MLYHHSLNRRLKVAELSLRDFIWPVKRFTKTIKAIHRVGRSARPNAPAANNAATWFDACSTEEGKAQNFSFKNNL